MRHVFKRHTGLSNQGSQVGKQSFSTSPRLRTTDIRLGSRLLVHQILFHHHLLQCVFLLIIINFSFLLNKKTDIHHLLLSLNEISSLSYPPSPPVTHNHPPNLHRIPRLNLKGTEQLENSVPSVLDSAASIFAGLEDVDVGDQVAVVSPASPTFDKGRSSGFASPIGSFRSRSPSPLRARMGVSGQSRAEMLLNLPPVPHAAPIMISVLGLHNMTSPTSSPPSVSATRPAITTSPTSNTITRVSHNNGGVDTPSIATPNSAYFSTVSDFSKEASPITTTDHRPNLPSPVSYPITLPQSIISSPVLAPTSLSLPPSPQPTKKRLSFMSYSDLLLSTPAPTQPLSSLTTSAPSTEPPPHIPGVSGLNIANALSNYLGSIHGSPFVAFSC
jgi:hypothetical protein